jgi:hypothetical protein
MRADEIHRDLAHWYQRVLDASESPAAVFEIVYHQCLAARAHLEMGSKEDSEGVWACERLDAASSLLKSQSYLIQTHGYSRGSCRRLYHISKTLCGSMEGEFTERHPQLAGALSRLRVVCTEIMRAIAREVGEDRKAYHRQREIAYIFLGTELLDYKGGEGKIAAALRQRLFPEQARDKPGWVQNHQAEWVRWWRWNGMLGIGSRSFEPARFLSINPLRAIKGPGRFGVRNSSRKCGAQICHYRPQPSFEKPHGAFRDRSLYVAEAVL